MVEDNKQLASRIDGDLQTAHQEVSLLRQELADTNRRITELTGLTPHDGQAQQQQEGGADSPDNATTPVNGSSELFVLLVVVLLRFSSRHFPLYFLFQTPYTSTFFSWLHIHVSVFV